VCLSATDICFHLSRKWRKCAECVPCAVGECTAGCIHAASCSPKRTTFVAISASRAGLIYALSSVLSSHSRCARSSLPARNRVGRPRTAPGRPAASACTRRALAPGSTPQSARGTLSPARAPTAPINHTRTLPAARTDRARRASAPQRRGHKPTHTQRQFAFVCFIDTRK